MQTERYFSPRYAQSLIPGMGRILLFIILVFSALHSYGYVVPGGATGECTANYDYFQHSSHQLAIQFQDLSTGPIGWWEWDFGDGDVSNEQNPLHQFPAPGWYWVCLTVSSPVKECNDIICIRIQVPQPTNCASTFTWTQSAVFPFTIDFTALPGPDADSLMWDFGDGITATGMNPQHTYADTGSFVVTLTATSYHNTVSCWSVYTDTVKVYIDPCISSFMAIPNPTNPLEVSFISSASGSVNSHFWNFGDGRTSFEINPVYTYSDTGTFYVCLTVSNFYYPQYCDDTSCQDVKIQITRCEADFISLQDTIYPLKFQFLNNSAGMLNAFNWDFGDGHSSTETNPLHSFPSPGDYQVQLIVQNTQYPELCGDTTNQVISISSLDCSASFSYLNDSLRPLDFKFFSQITGIPDHIEWNFGDGTTSYEPNPVHTFPDTGVYLVSLNVQNTAYPAFCSDNYSEWLNVRLKHRPVADFEIRFDSLSQVMNLFHFTDRSSGNKISNWQWAFGDGTGSTIQNPSHQYPPMQWFTACLTVADFLPPKYTLTDKKCKPLRSRAYFDLGGSVYDGTFPINNPQNKGDTALVNLYRVYPGPYIQQVASGRFHTLGYYWFSPVLQGEYIVKAELTEGSHQSGRFFPTYAVKGLIWEKADPVTLSKDVFDANIFLVPRPALGSGPGSIRGRVIHTSDPSSYSGEPAIHTTVFLADRDLKFLDFTYTDSLGNFSFHDLPFGPYVLLPDASGSYYTSDTARLTPQYPEDLDILLKIWEYGSTSAVSLPMNPGLQVFPNPVRNSLTVQFERNSPGLVQFELYSATGQSLLKTSLQSLQGMNSETFYLKDIPAGVYLLRTSFPDGATVYNKVIVR